MHHPGVLFVFSNHAATYQPSRPAMIETVGTHLANRVAQRLEEGRQLVFHHRDYCGMGLRYADATFIYGEVHDGQLFTDAELLSLGGAGTTECLVFRHRDEFVGWLARQSDDSLSGRHLPDPWLHDNQRITLSRLDAFASGYT